MKRSRKQYKPNVTLDRNAPPSFNKHGCEHFHRLRDGDTRCRFTIYLNSFRSYEEFIDWITRDPNILNHVIKNYEHYWPAIQRLHAITRVNDFVTFNVTTA